MVKENDIDGLEEEPGRNEELNFSQLSILDFVSKPTWKEFLMELIATEKLNPWDVDLVQVAEKYLAVVQKIQFMDLRIPANVILASSLLLRFKSEALRLEEAPVLFEEDSEEFVPIDEEIPDLLRRGILRKRKLTLDELINAIDKVIGDDLPRPVRQKPVKFLNIMMPEHDMHDLIKAVYEKILVKKDSQNLLLFSDLVDEILIENFMFNLMPVLHLMQDEKIIIWQDEHFSQIFIKVVGARRKEVDPPANSKMPELEAKEDSAGFFEEFVEVKK